jgi:spore maturation protein CgeB
MTRSLDIAFFGPSLVSSYWNHAAAYHRGIVRALADRGHDVTFYEPDAHDRQKHRDLADPSWATVVVYSGTYEADVYRRLDRARCADVVIKASNIGAWDALLEREVAGFEGTGPMAVFWDAEPAATLGRLEANQDDPLRALLPKYGLVLTRGGGPSVVQAYRRLGARDCVPIFDAVDPMPHQPVRPDPSWAADLTFLSTRTPDVEPRVEKYFLGAARLLPDRAFVLGGDGWAQRSLPPNVRAAGAVRRPEHDAAAVSARAVLELARGAELPGYAPAARLFQAAAAGACVVSDAWEGIESFFEPGREVLVAHDGEDVARHLRHLDDERARAIGAAARRRVFARHTFDHRASAIETLLLRATEGRLHPFDSNVSPQRRELAEEQQ